MGSLYEFKNFAATLEKLGFPSGNFKGTSTDFNKAIVENKIHFDDNGIIFNDNGIKRTGYVYIQNYPVAYYNTFPKFHTTKCKTIQEFISGGKFAVKYIWSNSETCDITDIDNNKIYPNMKLELCKNCIAELRAHNANVSFNTKEFYDKLIVGSGKSEPINGEYKLPIGLKEIQEQLAKEREKRRIAELENAHIKRRNSIIDLASKLDNILKRFGFDGESLMRRLFAAEGRLSNIVFKNAQAAIKIRNQIAHKEKYDPTDREIDNAILAFEQTIVAIEETDKPKIPVTSIAPKMTTTSRA
jgi:hypothetical protein